MRTLGIDVGLKRCGVALSDELGCAIRLLPNLQANSRAAAIEKIVALVNEFAVEAVVIGMPEAKTTGSIAIAKRAQGLKIALDEVVLELGITTQIFLWDETGTSKRAMANLVDANVPQKKRALLLDAASAAVIVEDFLASRIKPTDDQ